MKIALVAPSPVPFCLGGAENLWKGLLEALNQRQGIEADLIKLPTPERNAAEIIASYRAFAELDLGHFDRVISTKYPAWMVAHPHHTVYLQHTLRGLYDTYPSHLPQTLPRLPGLPADLDRLLRLTGAGREVLDDLFPQLAALYANDADLPPATRAAIHALPGPFLRHVVHFMDRIALAPGAIHRYFAIARTVAERPDYFPPGVPVAVIHHPTSLAGLHEGDAKAIFTASRLDAPKRIDLLIRAYLRSGVGMPLRIAGSGPQADALRQLAGKNPNIHFLGRITENQLVDEYAAAAFVPFLPEQEDYGLITLEAMLSAKPVLTTHDAGGVTELVRHEYNGLIVEPTEEALAKAIATLCGEPEMARSYGRQAKSGVSGINWSSLVEQLLDSACSTSQPRPRLLVANTFPIYPPRSGGQHRLYHIYRHLAERWDVVFVNLCPAEASAETLQLAPGLIEIRVPRSPEMQAVEADLDRRLSISSGDLAAMLHPESHHAWLMILREQAARTDAVVATHPYAWPALKKIWRGPIHYEAHNVEYDLKAPYLADHPEYLAQLQAIEGECARQAPCVFACSQQDAARLTALYGLSRPPTVIPNGVDTRQIRPLPDTVRHQLRQRLGLTAGGAGVALFIGSDHPPNREALPVLLACAEANPAINIMVIGSVVAGLPKALPVNLLPLGLVSEEEKRICFAAATFALNPMRSGSGTNLKLLDYAAAGLPILTTPFGARGGILGDAHLWYAECDEFPAALAQLLATDADALAERVVAARRVVEQEADWRAIAHSMAQALSEGQASSDNSWR